MKKRNKSVKAGIGYVIGNYLIKGLSFLTIPIFTRLLNTTDYGKYNTFLAYESIIFLFIGLALHSSYKNARYKYKTPKEGAKRGFDYYTYVSDSCLAIIVNAIIWFLLFNFFFKYFKGVLNFDRSSVNLLIAYGFGSAILNCYNADLSIRYEYKRYVVISGFNAIINTIVSVILIFTVFQNKRYLGRIIGTVIPVVLISFYILIFFFHRTHPRNVRKLLPWGIKYSLPIIPHGLSQVILNQFDRIMISSMVSDAATGIYSFAYNIYSIIQVTFTSLDTVWSPWFYEKMHKNDYQSIRKISSLYMQLMLLLCAIVILICPDIVKLLGSRSYWDAKYCAIPIVAGGFFSFLYTIPASVEYYYEKTKYIAAATGIAAIMNIILNYIFILEFGYVAAAYTTLATYFLYFLFHYLMAKHIQGYDLFSKKSIILCSIAIILITFVTNVIIDEWILRWLIALGIVVLAIVKEEKHLGLFREKKYKLLFH